MAVHGTMAETICFEPKWWTWAFITEYGIVSELIFNGLYRYSLSKKDILEEDLIMPKKYKSILTDNVFIASLCDLISRAY